MISTILCIWKKFDPLKCNRYSALDPTGPKPNTIYVYNQPELYIVVVQVTKNTLVRNLHLKAHTEEGKMNSFVPDAVDHKGNRADRTKTGGWLSAIQILGKFHFLIVHNFLFFMYVF